MTAQENHEYPLWGKQILINFLILRFYVYHTWCASEFPFLIKILVQTMALSGMLPTDLCKMTVPWSLDHSDSKTVICMGGENKQRKLGRGFSTFLTSTPLVLWAK